MYTDEENTILLTAFKEKDTQDYRTAITRAVHILAELEE